MSEASRRGRVTITLGRSGQVVKRAGPELDAGNNLCQLPRSMSKRSVRDRLGSHSNSSSLHGSEVSNKRQRGEANFSANDLQISKDDLRFKLMQKSARAHRQTQRDEESTMDLRAKLSRMKQPPHNVDTRPRTAERRDASVVGPLPPLRTAHGFSQMGPTSGSYSPWTLDHIRRRSPDRFVGTSRGLSPPRNAGSFIGTSRGLSPQRNTGSFVGTSKGLSLPRNAGSFIGTTSRGLSPTRNASSYVGSSRGFSPPRNVRDLHGGPLSRALDDVRISPYAGKHVLNAPYTTGTTLPPPTPKPPPLPALPSQLPPPGRAVQKVPFTVDEHQTVDGFLNSLGLGKYAITFKAEEVDMPALKQMGETDLKDLGVPMGPRKKILQALMPHSKRQP